MPLCWMCNLSYSSQQDAGALIPRNRTYTVLRCSETKARQPQGNRTSHQSLQRTQYELRCTGVRWTCDFSDFWLYPTFHPTCYLLAKSVTAEREEKFVLTCSVSSPSGISQSSDFQQFLSCSIKWSRGNKTAGSPPNQLQSISETVRAGGQSELLSQETALVWQETECAPV